MAKQSVSVPELGTSANAPVFASASSGLKGPSASAPELNASYSAAQRQSASDTEGQWQSSWLPVMTGTGPPPWWRAPMMEAMLQTGLLTPTTGPVMPTAAVPAMPEYTGPVTPQPVIQTMPYYRVTPQATIPALTECSSPVTSDSAIAAMPEYRRASSECADARPQTKTPLGPRRSLHGFPATASILEDEEFPVFHAPPPQRSLPLTGDFSDALRPRARINMPVMMPEPKPGRVHGIMPRMMPAGMVPRMFPRMMPRMMRGMMPRMMPGMMTGIPAARMPGQPMMAVMPMLQGMPGFHGMIPGMAPVHPQPPMMMPSVEPHSVPYHVAPATVLQQTTASEPRVITVPISGGGSGSQQPGLIPFPIPMPMPLPMPSPGSGGGGGQTPVIVTGTSPPSPAPSPHPYPYAQPCTHQCPSPPQQSPTNPLVETATISMMMQQMRFLLSPQKARRSRRRAPVLSVQTTSPLQSPVAVKSKPGDVKKAPDKTRGKKAVIKTAGKKKKSAKDGADDSSGSHASAEDLIARRKSVLIDKKEKEGGNVEDNQHGEKKEDDNKDKAGSATGTQGGESLGKGPSSNAPPLDLNFLSSSPLGHQVTSQEDETTVAQPCYLGYCFYLLFVALLAFFVVLALVPTLLIGFKEFLGFTEKPNSITTVDTSTTNKSQAREGVTINDAFTSDALFDIRETFGEVDIDGAFQNNPFVAPVTQFNTIGFVFDWLPGVAMAPGTEMTVVRNRSPPYLLRYFNEHLTLEAFRSGKNGAHTAEVTAAKPSNNRPIDLPLPIDVSGNTYIGADFSKLFLKGRGRHDTHMSSATSEASEFTIASESLQARMTKQASSAALDSTKDISTKSSLLDLTHSNSAGAQTQSAAEGLKDNLELLGGFRSPDVLGQWSPKARFLPFPDSVYFDWITTDSSLSSVPEHNATRQRQTNVTLSFFLPEIPSRNVGRTFFNGMLRKAGDGYITLV